VNPGLARIEDLAEAMRRSGLPVELRVDLAHGREIRHLPGPIDLAAYRIVQESLTNTLRHAPGARATVRIQLEDDCVDVLVTDSGGRRPASSPGGGRAGYGINGMRERARLCGGELTAGFDAAGGFTVRAVLPTAVMA
jgi:signal transduction histidine kinase